jgi:hypothetical protein
MIQQFAPQYLSFLDAARTDIKLSYRGGTSAGSTLLGVLEDLDPSKI